MIADLVNRVSGWLSLANPLSLGLVLFAVTAAVALVGGFWWQWSSLHRELDETRQKLRMSEVAVASLSLVNEATSTIVSEKAKSEQRNKIFYRTIVKEIERAPSDYRCVDSAPVRAALDGLRRRSAGGGAGADHPQGDPVVQGPARGPGPRR